MATSLAGSILLLSYREDIKSDKLSELSGIAELKTGQIAIWMAERRSDAQVLKDDALFVSAVDDWLRRGGPGGETKAKLWARLVSLQQAYGYTSVALLDEQAGLRLSSAAHEAPLQPEEKAHLLENMRTGQIDFSDLYWEKSGDGERIGLALRVPLALVRDDKLLTIGAVLFRIDPARFLFPLIQHWPTPSPSAESLLIRREGEEVVFLNELRHRKNTALALRLPLSRREVPAVMAALGQQGLVEGVDYRGVPVVGVLNQISGTSWAMVSKIDRAEIYAPINQLGIWVLLLMLTLIGVGGWITAYWWKMDLRRYEDELERQMLLGHLDYLAKYANDIILLLDNRGKIIGFNDRALAVYGYLAEDFSALNIADLLGRDFRPLLKQMLRDIDNLGTMHFEALHLRQSGESFEVEANVRLVELAGGKYYQAIIRDITERKHAEALFENEHSRLRTLVQTIPDLVWMKDTAGVFLSCNPQVERLYGAREAEIIGKTDFDFAEAKLATHFRQKDREAMIAGKPCINEEWVTYPDNGQRVLLETIKTPVRDKSGKLVGVMGIAREITERKQAEERESRLRHVLDSTLDMIFMFQPDSLRFVYVNKGAQDSVGYTFEELHLMTPPDIKPQIPEPEFRRLIAPLLAGGQKVLRFETVHRHKSGSDLPVEVQLQLVREIDGGSVFVAIVRDITERKSSEKELQGQKAFMRQVIDSDPNRIFVKDAQGVFLLANQSLASAYGLTPSELVGKNNAEISYSSGELEGYLAADRQVIEDGGEVRLTEPYTSSTGARRWFLTLKKRLTMPDGSLSVLGISVDITQQKRSEMELARSYKELQRLSLHLESVRADERTKIARNLHDEMGATLVAMKMSTAWLAAKLPSDVPQLQSEVARIAELISDGIHTVHQIVTELRPNLLDDLGLTAAINDYVKKFQMHTNIKCILDLSAGELSLDDDQSLTVFRILQESLCNVAKHAQASLVNIDFAERGGALLMVVKDNGVGFDLAEHKEHAFGLLGIRERALMVGGKARIKSSPGKGTRVSVSLPPASHPGFLES
ncbi:MAG: PAS domain S-box protein [Nitrosomonadales bacterium]|nr:PAS domain S-box protein [Nitrosomonadales bacterium]